MKNYRNTYLFIGVLVAFLFVSTSVNAQSSQQQTQVFQAEVVKVVNTGQYNQQTKREIKNTTVTINSGSLKGRNFLIKDNAIPTAHELSYKAGDTVMITYFKDPQGNEVTFITDVTRQTPLLILFVLFLILTIVVARWQGITSLIGMALSFVIIGKFIIPNILIGNNPLVITFFASLFIIPILYYIAHGVNKKTSIAVVGTVITLFLTAILTVVFVYFTKLSGYETEEAVFLQNINSNIDIKSMLLAGIIIGILAVLDDITVSQASVVNSICNSKPSISLHELYSSAMAVGRDHIASLVNTLILVYAGAALPLFALFSTSPQPWQQVINQEAIATEIIRTLVSSIGIIAAVPLTTYLAAVIYKKKYFS